MKNTWVALSSAPFLCLFLLTQCPTQDKMYNFCHVLRETEVVIFLVQQEVLVSCFLSSGNLRFLLWPFAIFFFPLTIILPLSSSSW